MARRQQGVRSRGVQSSWVQDITAKGFFRAASQRYEASTILFEAHRFLDRIYLGGYVAECALKSLILNRTPSRKQADTVAEISKGSMAHNFDILSGILERKQVAIPESIRDNLRMIHGLWGTHLRYVGARAESRTAREFRENIKFVLDWVERSLG